MLRNVWIEKTFVLLKLGKIEIEQLYFEKSKTT